MEKDTVKISANISREVHSKLTRLKRHLKLHNIEEVLEHAIDEAYSKIEAEIKR